MSHPDAQLIPAKDGWTMPDPPHENAVAAYYNDNGEIHLYWTNEDQDSLGDIEWPFDPSVDHVTYADLNALGFKDAEDI